MSRRLMYASWFGHETALNIGIARVEAMLTAVYVCAFGIWTGNATEFEGEFRQMLRGPAFCMSRPIRAIQNKTGRSNVGGRH
jgi:hypothetical protein